MGRVGTAGDKEAMESFFALQQKNVLDRRSWCSREELRISIVTWIEGIYRRRRQTRPRPFDAGLIRIHPDLTGQSGRVTETFT